VLVHEQTQELCEPAFISIWETAPLAYDGAMSRSRKILIPLALIIFATAITLLLLFKTQHEPAYQDRPLSYWFTQLPVTPVLFPPQDVYSVNVVGFMNVGGQQYGSRAIGDTNAIEALQFFGTNAVPLLLRKLQERDFIIEKEVSKIASQAGVKSLPFRKADLERYQAVTGLINLKSLPPDALQLISVLSTNSHQEIAWAASYVLKRRAAISTAEKGQRNR